MKLYFYILHTPYKEKPYIQFSECEVEEKPKTYKPVDKFPSGYYGCYVKKEDIGHLSGYSRNIVILTEKNNEFVKEKFSNYFNRSIKTKQNELEELQELLNIVSEWED